MSIVKDLLIKRDKKIVDCFIELIMLQGGYNDLRKRKTETVNALSFAKVQKENNLVIHLRRELKGIYRGLNNQVNLINSKHIEYRMIKGHSKFGARGSLSTIYSEELTLDQTKILTEYIEQNYHQRKPFPYPILFVVFCARLKFPQRLG